MKNCISYTQSTILLICLLIISLSACQDDDVTIVDQNVEEFISALPENVQYPADNQYSQQKEELGRLLYWDPILSGTKDVACVSCHHPSLGYADGIEFSQGVGGVGLGSNRSGGLLTSRNAHTVINTAFNGIDNNGVYNPSLAPMFWDSRAESLEEQALLPMLSKEEMRGELISEDFIMDTIIQRLKVIPEYVTMFEEVFGSNEISQEAILAAIATFERSIIANNSRFDQYMRGDVNALNNVEIQGMNAFIQVGCADCHSGPMFSDYLLHTIGVMNNNTLIDDGATNSFDFRTPTLRNLNLTAPYMHNGIHETLQDVLNFYEDLSEGNDDQLNTNVAQADLDDDIQDLELNGGEIDAIIDFLNTLNDDNFDRTIPDSVPSGLAVGGNID